MTIDELLQCVKSRSGLTSIRQIANRLDISPTSISAWTRRRAIPTEDNVLALCMLAGEPPEPWFLALGEWRTTGPSQQVYRSIAAAVEQRPFPIEAAE